MTLVIILQFLHMFRRFYDFRDNTDKNNYPYSEDNIIGIQEDRR